MVVPFVLEIVLVLPTEEGTSTETTELLDKALTPAADRVASLLIALAMDPARILKVVSVDATEYCTLCLPVLSAGSSTVIFTTLPVVVVPVRFWLKTVIMLSVSVPVVAGETVVTPSELAALTDMEAPNEEAEIPAEERTESLFRVLATDAAKMLKVVSVD